MDPDCKLVFIKKKKSRASTSTVVPKTAQEMSVSSPVSLHANKPCVHQGDNPICWQSRAQFNSLVTCCCLSTRKIPDGDTYTVCARSLVHFYKVNIL